MQKRFLLVVTPHQPGLLWSGTSFKYTVLIFKQRQMIAVVSGVAQPMGLPLFQSHNRASTLADSCAYKGIWRRAPCAISGRAGVQRSPRFVLFDSINCDISIVVK